MPTLAQQKASRSLAVGSSILLSTTLNLHISQLWLGPTIHSAASCRELGQRSATSILVSSRLFRAVSSAVALGSCMKPTSSNLDDAYTKPIDHELLKSLVRALEANHSLLYMLRACGFRSRENSYASYSGIAECLLSVCERVQIRESGSL